MLFDQSFFYSEPQMNTPSRIFLYSGLSLLAALFPVAAQNTPSYQLSTATGENGTSLPISETTLLFSQLPRQASSTSNNVTTGVEIGRFGNYYLDRVESDLSNGLSLYAEAETTLALNDAPTVPAYTFNYLRPYSKTELKVVNEKLYPTPLSGQSATTVRLDGFLSVAANGIFPQERSWRNSALSILSISASVRQISNDQLISGTSGSFRINNSLNNTSTLVGTVVESTLGGSNGAWNIPGGSGNGFISVSVPANAYVLVQVTLSTEVEITQFASSSGTALSTFKSVATGRVKATAIGGGVLGSSLGLSKLYQSFPIKNYAIQSLNASPLALTETASSGLPVSYELISGPAAISGNTLNFDGPRGIILFRLLQNGNDTYAPANPITREVDVIGNAQTITFPTQASRPANHVPFSPGATSSSGLPVTYEILSGPASTNGTLVTLTGEIETVNIRARQAGDGSFEPATPVDRSVTITAAIPAGTAQTITFPSLINANVGEGQLALATSTSGLPVTLTIVEGSARLAGVNNNILIPTGPGLIRVVASQLGGVSDSVSYQPATTVERSMTATSLFLNALIDAGVPADKREATDDADGDGVANLVEFALGGNPNNASDRPAIVYERGVAGLLSLTYRRVRSDVTYMGEVASALDTWSSTGVDQGSPDPDGNVTATAPSSGNTRFIRLSVSYP